MRPSITALPAVAALAAIVLLNVVLTVTKISTPFPNSPYESATFSDAWRMAHGQALYGNPEETPSPMMYGPLTPLVLSVLFRFAGPGFYAGRVVSLAASLAVTCLLAAAMTHRRPRSHFLAAWIFLSGANLCSKLYFVETRPDMCALLFAAGALLCMVRAHAHASTGWQVLSSALLLVSFLFKQTAAMFTAVPLLVCAMEGRAGLTKGKLARAALPMLTLLATILLLRTAWPWAYHYMIAVNAGNSIKPFNAAIRTLQLFSLSPLALFLALDRTAEPGGRMDPTLRWLGACAMVTVPSCVVTASPTGGDLNALLPAWLVFACFCAHLSPRLFELVSSPSRRFWNRTGSSAVIAALLLLSTMGQLHTAIPASLVAHGDSAYAGLVALASRLPGTVACPQDPTIPILARGVAGRSVYAECAHSITGGEWPSTLPPRLAAEISAADFVIRLNSYFGNLPTPPVLSGLGFELVEVPGLSGSCYQLWRRARR